MPTVKIVPFPGAPGPAGAQGPRGYQGETGLTGPAGPQGQPGADALWNFLGEYDNGADYSVGDVVTFAGGTYYRIGEANPGYAPGTEYWTTIAEPGADGADGEDAEVVSEISFTVNGGTTGNQPTFDGTPLFSGSYVKTGPLVFFQIQVDMDNITDFGSGQYYVDLPFDAKYPILLRDGCLHDESTGNEWSISGHVAAGTNRLFLFYTAGTGQDEFFDYNSPITLNALDNFHVSGTYIAE